MRKTDFCSGMNPGIVTENKPLSHSSRERLSLHCDSGLSSEDRVHQLSTTMWVYCTYNLTTPMFTAMSAHTHTHTHAHTHTHVHTH